MNYYVSDLYAVGAMQTYPIEKWTSKDDYTA